MSYVRDGCRWSRGGDDALSIIFLACSLSPTGIATSLLIISDVIFAGWSPFFSMAITDNVQRYLEGLENVIAIDFDVLVGSHLTRLGTTQDVQTKIDFFADVLAGAELGFEKVSFLDVKYGTAVFDMTNPNFGNQWLLFNEYQDRIVDACYNYILDSNARGRDWATELAGLEITLRSHCWMMQEFVSVG